MFILRRACLCLVAVFCLTAPAAASWQADIEHDDFGSDHVGYAMTTTTDGRALILRCENGRAPALVFATLELWADHLAIMPAKLLIKIDDGETETRQAVLEQYPMMIGLTQQPAVRVVAAGDHLFPILDAVAKAKQRIAVAVEVSGQRFENTRFSVTGSRSSFKEIWEYCGSRMGQDKKPAL